MENSNKNVDAREGSNSVSTPRAPQSRKNIITLPRKALKFEGSQAYIIYRRNAYKVSLTPEGYYKYQKRGHSVLVEVV